MVQRRFVGQHSDPFVESRRVNAMLATPLRSDGRLVSVATPPLHYGMTPGSTPGKFYPIL